MAMIDPIEFNFRNFETVLAERGEEVNVTEGRVNITIKSTYGNFSGRRIEGEEKGDLMLLDYISINSKYAKSNDTNWKKEWETFISTFCTNPPVFKDKAAADELQTA